MSEDVEERIETLRKLLPERKLKNTDNQATDVLDLATEIIRDQHHFLTDLDIRIKGLLECLVNMDRKFDKICYCVNNSEAYSDRDTRTVREHTKDTKEDTKDAVEECWKIHNKMSRIMSRSPYPKSVVSNAFATIDRYLNHIDDHDRSKPENLQRVRDAYDTLREWKFIK